MTSLHGTRNICRYTKCRCIEGRYYLNIKTIIGEAIQETGHHPFLFVGSGLSRRYMGTEKWDELLRKFCTEFSDNEFQYDVYANRIDEKDYYGQQPAIAQLLEKDYNNEVLTSDKYFDFRTRHKDILKNNVSALKIAISEHLSKCKVQENNEELKLFEKLAKRSVSGIITTNYDNLMDAMFPRFDKYIGQEELIFANITGIGEIYKIHGSVTVPESLVLTSRDYKEFEEKSAYLISKLLTIFLEYPIIFLGYSLNDRNIRNIFSTISNCLSQEKLDKLRNRMIFVEYSEVEKISEFSMQFENGNSVKMNCISTEDFSEVYSAILSVKSKYNPSLLRALRKDIYELANSTKPTEIIVATGFENLDDISEAEQFILGIGVAKNGHMIKAEQLYEDIVFDNQYFNCDLVVEEYLPDLLKKNSGGLPMYKYLKDYHKEVFERVKDNVLKYTDIDNFLNEQLRKQKASYHKIYTELSVKRVVELEGEEQAYRKLIFLNEDEIDCSELLSYLQGFLKRNTPKVLYGNSELKRLIRIYDLLKYK
jgi:hypothetical protein